MPTTNQSTIPQFVRVYRKQTGRPKGAASSAAAVAQGSNSSAASASDAGGGGRKKSGAKPYGQRGKVKTGYSSGDNLELMTRAVSAWYELVAKGGKHVSMTAFAKLRGIEPGTFRKYACGDKTKRRKLGASSGRKALVSDADQQLIVDSIRRRDRSNEGVSTQGAIDMVRTLKPEFTHKMAENQSFNTLKRKNGDVLTARMVVPQNTTTQRCAITVAQQYRWHKLIDGLLADLRTRNTGVCRFITTSISTFYY